MALWIASSDESYRGQKRTHVVGKESRGGFVERVLSSVCSSVFWCFSLTDPRYSDVFVIFEHRLVGYKYPSIIAKGSDRIGMTIQQVSKDKQQHLSGRSR